MKANTDPKYMLFPSLETRWLFLFPERQKAHRELDLFLEKMQEIIDEKRKTLAGDTTIATKSRKEKDLLTLMLEASQEGNGVLTDEELQVRSLQKNINIECSSVFSRVIFARSFWRGTIRQQTQSVMRLITWLLTQ